MFAHGPRGGKDQGQGAFSLMFVKDPVSTSKMDLEHCVLTCWERQGADGGGSSFETLCDLFICRRPHDLILSHWRFSFKMSFGGYIPTIAYGFISCLMLIAVYTYFPNVHLDFECTLQVHVSETSHCHSVGMAHGEVNKSWWVALLSEWVIPSSTLSFSLFLNSLASLPSVMRQKALNKCWPLDLGLHSLQTYMKYILFFANI